MSRQGADAALQGWLAGEHAAVYGYGVLGGRLPRPMRSAAIAARDAHRARRDGLQELLTGRGQLPVPAAPAYDVPGPPGSPAEALVVATGIEERLARATYAVVVAADTPAVRRLAAGGLQEQAVRATGWRARASMSPAPTAFPGRP